MKYQDKKFNSGLIQEKQLPLLYPCFFLGITEAGHEARVEQNDWTAKPGQYILNHKFEGHACSLAVLQGVFLPIASARRKIIEDGFLAVSKRYRDEKTCYLHPYWKSPPDKPLIGIGDLRNDIAKFISIGIRDVYFPDGTAEALIRFLDSEALLSWLRKEGFKYVSNFPKIGGMRLSALPWPNLAQFILWLNGGGTEIKADKIEGAFLYQNSD